MRKIAGVWKKVYLLMGMFVLFASGDAMAQTGFGIRAGVSIDPDQFHFGGHFISDPLISNLTFRPNLEIGVGNSVTTVAANLEFAFRIPVPKSQLSAYIGAGPALNVYRHGESPNRPADTNTGGGFNILVGLEHREGLFGELKVGAIDSPEVKLTVGFTFR
jgi:hypothetical protein